MIGKLYTRNAFWLRAAFVVAGALALLWTPLWNGYPFVYTDSGTYIFSGAIMYVPLDRSIGYGVFLYRLNLFNSLWGVAGLQALVASYLMFRVAELVLDALPFVLRPWISFAIVILTALTTTVSTFVGFISPDIFTSWLFLGGIVFLLSAQLYERVVAGGLIALALWAHNSHPALGLAMILLLALVILVLPPWRARLAPRVMALCGLVVLTLFGIVAVNFYLHAGITLGRGGTTILLNRFVASGVLSQTLETYCGEQTWILCNYQARLSKTHPQPDWYLWGADSPINQVGWDKNEAEQRALLVSALRCCAARIAMTSAAEAWNQFWRAPSGTHIVALGDEWNVVQAIRRLYPHEVDVFQHSGQQTKKQPPLLLLPWSEESVQWVGLALLLALLAFSIYQKETKLVFLIGALLVFLVLNAALVGAVNGASGRYQARIVWLVPYWTYIALAYLGYSFAARRGWQFSNSQTTKKFLEDRKDASSFDRFERLSRYRAHAPHPDKISRMGFAHHAPFD